MASSDFVGFELPDGRFIEAEIVIESYGCGPTMPSWNYAGDPGDPPEWYVKTIDIDDERVPLRVYKPWWAALLSEWKCTDPTIQNPEFEALSETIDAWVIDNHDFEPPDYDDYDDWHERDY